ncbi:sulfite exporter TauE/SafE family protein [Acidaminobacter sp. JC074]|uniref:sulfite exporter TauE/SafE family protein n=1 Tax=Acidaminobacter sp. JC074 TaxID=2530199 RepID=UPI001F105323|nr:sulfite exporter TauE/SafE family protein [Acidaminobacter sp. JC074]MCH4889587.1 sulfite exporter TauE/SafE family protein [Acidaminobacter sp. JC074]
MIDYNYLIVLLIAGLMAGIITGLVAASASVIMTPILTIFLKMDVYSALGISLAADVIASLTTTYVYHKHDCVAYKKSTILILVAVIFTLIGSYLTHNTSNTLLGVASGIGICILAFQFLKGNFTSRLSTFKKNPIIGRILKRPQIFILASGIIIGLNTGVMGAGGGVLILFTMILSYDMEMKRAIGTSAFVMMVIAFCGAAIHFYYGTFTLTDTLFASSGALTGAFLASNFVHASNENKLSKIVGTIFSCIGTVMVINQLL